MLIERSNRVFCVVHCDGVIRHLKHPPLVIIRFIMSLVVQKISFSKMQEVSRTLCSKSGKLFERLTVMGEVGVVGKISDLAKILVSGHVNITR